MIIDHNNKAYIRKWGLAAEEPEREYSELLTGKIIPKVKTDRDWVTVNVGQATDGAIVMVHDSARCGYLARYKDLVLICKTEDDAAKVESYGKTVVLTGKLRDQIKTIQAAV